MRDIELLIPCVALSGYQLSSDLVFEGLLIVELLIVVLLPGSNNSVCVIFLAAARGIILLFLFGFLTRDRYQATFDIKVNVQTANRLPIVVKGNEFLQIVGVKVLKNENRIPNKLFIREERLVKY